MNDSHIEETELLRLALADSEAASERTLPGHLATCPACRAAVETLRAQANALRLSSERIVPRPDCLDEETIAALAEGTVDLIGARAAFEHLLTCPRCCREFASAARLLADPQVRKELELVSSRKRWRPRIIGGLLLAAAAASILFILLGPLSVSKVAKPPLREESLTGAAAPRLIAPIGAAAAADTFRWTSVPRADRYHITVFARDGSAVWEAFTRDTNVAVPGSLMRFPDSTYLWRVESHVGWEDRWTASELSMVTLPRATSR